MAKRTVVWTQTAIKQRHHILRYWTVRNKSTAYAKKLILLIRERIDLIEQNPQAGKRTNHLDTREAAMGNFSIYYKYTEDKIFITAFWDNHQDPNKLESLLK